MLRTLLFAMALLAVCWASPQPPVKLAGRDWIPWNQARGQGERPILLVQMLGDLDEEWC